MLLPTCLPFFYWSEWLWFMYFMWRPPLISCNTALISVFQLTVTDFFSVVFFPVFFSLLFPFLPWLHFKLCPPSLGEGTLWFCIRIHRHLRFTFSESVIILLINLPQTFISRYTPQNICRVNSLSHEFDSPIDNSNAISITTDVAVKINGVIHLQGYSLHTSIFTRYVCLWVCEIWQNIRNYYVRQNKQLNWTWGMSRCTVAEDPKKQMEGGACTWRVVLKY